MSRPPWHNDHPLSASGAAALLTERLPDLGFARLDYLGEGWDFVTWRIDRTLVLRLPKRVEVADQLETEARVLPALARRIADMNVAVPMYRHLLPGRAGSSYPLPFGIYGFIPGTPMDHGPAPAAARHYVPDALGTFLARVHGYRPAGRDPKRSVGDGFRRHLAEIERMLGETAPVIPRSVVDAVGRSLAHPPPHYAGGGCFIHHDLVVEHLLIDGAGRLAGVIDWGDADWGEPWSDFVGLWAWGGDAVAKRAFRSYGAAPGATDWQRLRFRGACIAVAAVHYGLEAGIERHVEAGSAWLARMHAAGQLDDPATEEP